MKNLITATLFLSLFALLFIFSTASSALADEFCRPCPFDCISIGVSSDHCSSRGVLDGLCCVDLDNDGQDQLRNYGGGNRGIRPGGRRGGDFRGQGIRPDGRFNGVRDGRRGVRPGGRFNGVRDGRRGGRRDFNNTNTSIGTSNECPSGFNLRDFRCSDSERANGCQDTRSASGRSCIRWGRAQRRGRSDRGAQRRGQVRNLALECPSGFTYRITRCSPIEKAQGCKDTRSRSGASCIRF